MDTIYIQVQDDVGVWRTIEVTQNNSQRIINAMRSVSRRFPGKRIRAVDSEERIVDIL